MNPCVQLNTHRTSAPPLPNRIFSTPLSVVVHMNTSKNYSALHTMSAQVDYYSDFLFILLRVQR